MSSQPGPLGGSTVNINNSVQLNEKLILPLLAFTVMIVVMNTTMFNLALPIISKELQLSGTTASWIVTGYSIIFSIASITYSRLSDFIPVRTLIVVGLTALGSASLLGLFSHHFMLLLLARLLQAFGAGSILSLAIVLISRYVPIQRRGKAMSFMISLASLGFGLGPLLGGIVIEYLGWSYLFLITCIVLLLIGVTSYMINFASLFLMPQILTHLYGYSSVQSGLIIFPGAILAVLASRKIGTVLDQKGNGAILRYAPYLLLISCLLLALFATHSPFAILFIYVLLNLAVSSITAAVSNELSRLLTPAETGAGMGLSQLSQFISGAFAVALLGSAMEWQSKLSLTKAYSNLFWATGVIALLCILSMIIYYGRKGQKSASIN